MAAFASAAFSTSAFSISAFSMDSAAPVVVVTQAIGSSGRGLRRKDERWSLTLAGKVMVFTSLDALIAFLDAREVIEVEDAKEKAEADAQRIVSLGRARAKPVPPKVQIVSPVAEITEYVDAVQAKIDRLYWRALGEALAREAEEDEDIAFIATIQ